MTRTPWGDTDEFRARKLQPGMRLSPEQVAGSQRERLYGAMVAAVAERGYEATSVSDLVSMSGVSRSAFYQHFKDKQECFMATLEAVLRNIGRIVSVKYDGKGSALRAFADIISEQPATARLCFLEVYPAGPDAVELMDHSVAGVEALYRQAFAARAKQPEMPSELVRAIVGGLRRVIYTSLLDGTESELSARAAELWSWSFGYEAPPKPLRRRSSRHGKGTTHIDQSADAADRIVAAAGAAIAKRGYATATITEIVERVEVSLSTFYTNFDGKESAFWAALDAGQARMFARMLPVFRRTRGQGWPQAVAAGCDAMIGFLSAEPDFARLAIIETYSAGARAMELRNRTVAALKPYLNDGFKASPGLSQTVGEAIPGAVSALVYNQIRAAGPESLPEVGAMAIYLVLAPFLGAEEACSVARGER